MINNPQTDEHLHLLAGEVISTCKSGDNFSRQATELKLDHIAVRYLGP